MRHKGDNVGISSLDELEDAILEIGALDRDMRANSDQMNARLDEIKAEHKTKHDELGEERYGLLLRVQAYVEPRREALLGRKKTRRVNFGKFGWRKLPDRIDVPKRKSEQMDELVGMLASLRAAEPDVFGDISIYTDQWVTAADLKKLSDEDLGRIGLTRKKGPDEFFVEPDEEKLEAAEKPEAA